MLCIFFVEDDNDMCWFLVKVFENVGYDVVFFDNGKSVYEWLCEELFLFLLIDIVMFEMDGIELVRCVI